MSKATLHLLMGLPGAGKSTLARQLSELTKATRLSSDETRIMLFDEPCFSQDEHDRLYAILDHNLEHLLAAGMDVIYDANLNRRVHRDEKYATAKEYDAEVKLWWVQTPEELAKQRRVDEQDELLLPEGETSEKMFDRIAAIIEEPGKDEPHVVIDGRNIRPDDIKKHLS